MRITFQAVSPKSIASSLLSVLIWCLITSAQGTSAEPEIDSLLRPTTGERIKWQVIAGGGSRGSSTNFVLSGTAGQTAVGQGSSTNFGINHGFWQNLTLPCMCGDANGSGSINISDAVYIINYIFAGGPAPNPICLGDANGTGTVNISDAVYIINFIFNGGLAPYCP